MATVSAERGRGGYGCEFVKTPPTIIQSECPVCLLVLCEPYQAPCCGNSFCRVCIERIKDEKKPCPTCKEENLTVFHNKGLQRSLYEFQVYCSHKQEGCEWKGELGQLDNHLNLSPQPDKQLEGCEYSEIECIYCAQLTNRSDITVHRNDLCPKRPFSCEYCQTYKTNYDDVVNNHWPVCGYHPVQCPNECGTFPQRQALENHVTRDCPNTVIDCDFHHVGCDVRPPRKDMQAHLKENLVTHMSLQAASYSKLLASHNELLQRQTMLENKVTNLESENTSLKHQLEANQKQHKQTITKIEQQITTLQKQSTEASSKIALQQETVSKVQEIQQTVPIPQHGHIEFIVENYKQQKATNSSWTSLPFYTHLRGYKLCCRVFCNGAAEGKGTHVSVYVYLMRGEFDDNLKWPLRCQIIVRLVDQEGEGENYTDTINFNQYTPSDYACRVIQRERSKCGWGMSQFILQDNLTPKYLKNDCLSFVLIMVQES